jgi:beta-lactamase class A
MSPGHRALTVLVAATLTAAGVAVPAQSPPAPRSSAAPANPALRAALRATFERQLADIADGLDGVLGYAIIDLTDGQRITRLGGVQFATASTIKLAVLYELLKQAEEGRLALDTPRPLDPAQVVGGSGILQHLSRPALSLRDHAALMLILSDNTATNVVIDAVGMAAVNTRMQALGIHGLTLRRRMMDGAAAARGDENTASPEALVASAVAVWKGDGLTAASRDLARTLLHQVPGRIRDAVPARVQVASKTGTLAGVRAEAAVIEIDGRPFALAVMTTHLRDEGAGERAIRAVADATFAFAERVALGGAYGRK